MCVYHFQAHCSQLHGSVVHSAWCPSSRRRLESPQLPSPELWVCPQLRNSTSLCPDWSHQSSVLKTDTQYLFEFSLEHPARELSEPKNYISTQIPISDPTPGAGTRPLSTQELNPQKLLKAEASYLSSFNYLHRGVTFSLADTFFEIQCQISYLSASSPEWIWRWRAPRPTARSLDWSRSPRRKKCPPVSALWLVTSKQRDSYKTPHTTDFKMVTRTWRVWGNVPGRTCPTGWAQF